jgi:hypothetical protein
MKEEKENQEDFSKLEDDIIILLNKLSSTIDTFNTLSRDQAEKAILETNSKINDCKEIIDKMEEYIKDHDADEDIDKNELNKKILNYKTEYHEILNKYNSVQDNYINKKTENALMEDENENNLVDDDDDKNKKKDNKNKKKEELIIDGELDDHNNKKNNNDNNNKRQNKDKNEGIKNKNEISLISANNKQNNNILENNNAHALDFSLTPKINIENDEAFNQINKDYDSKKKKTVCICVAVCIFIFLIIILSATLSRK